MGFRSNFITEHIAGVKVPDWFVEKYPNHFVYKNSEDKNSFPIIQPYETKFYSKLDETEIFTDIQKVLVEEDYEGIMTLILLHECGGITKVKITQETITGMEPTKWKKVQSVEHSYCYGCSENV